MRKLPVGQRVASFVGPSPPSSDQVVREYVGTTLPDVVVSFLSTDV
jgi:hypothetical protein